MELGCGRHLEGELEPHPELGLAALHDLDALLDDLHAGDARERFGSAVAESGGMVLGGIPLAAESTSNPFRWRPSKRIEYDVP